MSLRDAGLLIFVEVVLILLIGLFVDDGLERAGIRTISERVWEGNWPLGAVILAIEAVGWAGLALHFFGPKP